ncbi:cysteine dioxygenase, partial [Bordetella pertussis]
ATSPEGPGKVLRPGDVACVSPSIGDIHQVSNAYDDRVSISIHLYGGNIGRIRRSVYDPQTGASKAFVSGYSNAMTPNLWAAPNAG